MTMLKWMVVLAQVGLAASLEAGDCAFVGLYGEKDDFALVLLEDVDENLYLTETLPSAGTPVSNFLTSQLKTNKRGAVLKKSDFGAGESMVAPSSIFAFVGSPESPLVLCSIAISEGSSKVRQLSEANVVLNSDTAQYVGSTSGTKEELLDHIGNMENWIHSATSRKLEGFSIDGGHGGNHTHTMTTTPMPMNMTTTMMADADTTMTTTMTTSMTAPAARTVVSGCTVLSGAVEALVDNADAATAFGKAIASLASVPESYVQNVVIALGSSCGMDGMRRLGGRRLQSGATASYDIVFPASLGALGSNTAAQQAISSLSTATPASVTTALSTELAAIPELANVDVTVDSFEAPMILESGGSTPPPPPPPSTTPAKTDNAATMGITLGMLMLVVRLL